MLDRLDLAAKARERPPAQCAKHTGVHPLRARQPRTELSLDDRAGLREAPQRVDDRRLGKTKPPRRVRHTEWPVRAGVPPQQRHERIDIVVREKSGWQPQRQADSESVSVASRILRGDETPLARDANVEHAALGHERRDPVVHRRRLSAASADLLRGQIAQTKEHFVYAVGVTRGALADQVL